jgi:hypothetical protein
MMDDNMKWIDDFILIESFKYDNEELIELQRFDKRGTLLEHKTRVQLEKEWEELETEKDDEKEETVGDQDVVSFDENGRVVKREFYEDGLWNGAVTHEFDKEGNHVAMVWLDAAGHITSRYTDLCRNNRLLIHKCYDGNGRLCWTTRYVYNQDGCCLEQNTYNGKFLFYKVIFAYDENQRKTSVQQFVHKDYKWNICASWYTPYTLSLYTE